MKKLKLDKDGRLPTSEVHARIRLSQLRPLDILQYFHGNKLTEWVSERGQAKKYIRSTLAPYHTNLVYDIGKTHKKTILMDTEVRNTASILETEYMTKANSRIDVIRPIGMQDNPALRKHILDDVAVDLGKELYYGVLRFGAFAKRLSYVGRALKWVKPSKKQVVCSGRVAKVFENNGFPVSPFGYNETIPNDILVYALHDQPFMFEVYTLKIVGEVYDIETNKVTNIKANMGRTVNKAYNAGFAAAASWTTGGYYE